MTEFLKTLEKEEDVSAIFGAVHDRQGELHDKLQLWSHDRYNADVASVGDLDDLLFIRAFYDTISRPWQWMLHDDSDRFDAETHLLCAELARRDGRGENTMASASFRLGRTVAWRVTGFDPERMVA